MKAAPAVVLFLVMLALAVIWQSDRTTDTKITALRDTVRVLDVRRDTIRDTLRVRERAKARVDTLVQTLTDTQLVIRETPASPPETVTVRAPIVERIRTDSSLIATLYQGRRTDSAAIAARDRL